MTMKMNKLKMVTLGLSLTGSLAGIFPLSASANYTPGPANFSCSSNSNGTIESLKVNLTQGPNDAYFQTEGSGTSADGALTISMIYSGNYTRSYQLTVSQKGVTFVQGAIFVTPENAITLDINGKLAVMALQANGQPLYIACEAVSGS